MIKLISGTVILKRCANVILIPCGHIIYDVVNTLSSNVVATLLISWGKMVNKLRHRNVVEEYIYSVLPKRNVKRCDNVILIPHDYII